MLGQWFYLKNRLLEGHVFIVRATRFAAALGLHELDSCIYGHYVARVMGSSKRKMGRWSPRDSVELGEAINLWWACFERDYGGSLINGLPPSISLKDIKTGWPVALADFEAVDLAFSRPSGSEVTDEWWARFEECDRAIDIFTTSVQRAYVNRDIQEALKVILEASGQTTPWEGTVTPDASKHVEA
ncbi:hypothetical protein RhiTH_006489 [Rhizoctonia solani]